jgi:CHASE1-domain containing sensor protein
MVSASWQSRGVQRGVGIAIPLVMALYKTIACPLASEETQSNTQIVLTEQFSTCISGLLKKINFKVNELQFLLLGVQTTDIDTL